MSPSNKTAGIGAGFDGAFGLAGSPGLRLGNGGEHLLQGFIRRRDNLAGPEAPFQGGHDPSNPGGVADFESSVAGKLAHGWWEAVAQFPGPKGFDGHPGRARQAADRDIGPSFLSDLRPLRGGRVGSWGHGRWYQGDRQNDSFLSSL